MKRLSLLCLSCLLFFSSCKSVHLFSSRGEKPTQAPKGSNYTAESYIQRYQEIAREEMKKNGIPASIKLAQGLLESANGNSELALKANNHFGIKCNGEWKGKSIRKDDDEKDECFRVYPSPEESYKDHSEFLKRKRYEALFKLDRFDYKAWARGLKAAGYATNPKYPDLLISMIERDQLYRYDEKDYAWDRIKREHDIVTETRKEAPEVTPAAEVKAAVSMKIYEVKADDTLYAIAQKFGLRVEELKSLNNIKTETLYVGQLLIVSK